MLLRTHKIIGLVVNVNGQAIPVLGGVCTVVKGERFCFRPKITFPKKKHSNRLLRKQVLLYSFPSRSLPASDMQGMSEELPSNSQSVDSMSFASVPLIMAVGACASPAPIEHPVTTVVRSRSKTPNVMTQRNDSKLIGIIECTELSGGIRRSGKTKLLIYSHNLRQKLNPKQGENSKL